MRALEFITGDVIYNLASTYKFQLKTTQVILLPWMETYFYNQDLGHLRKRDLGLLRNLRKRDLALLRKDWRGLRAMRARP